MNIIQKRRLTYLIILLIGVSIAIGIALFALKQNINLYYTPSEVITGHAPLHHTFRMGGLVKKGSVLHGKQGLQVSFVVTDLKKEVTVVYEGILPDLFHDGQGVVVQGQLLPSGSFRAEQVLAKHDEKYMPPAAAAALKS
jgi:cytochrome c-type biogenesis protein CcmE